MSTKDTGIYTESQTGSRVDYSDAGVPSYSTTASFVRKANRSYKLGIDIPNFYRRKRAGELLPHTPFTQVEWEGRLVTSHVETHDTQDLSAIVIDGYAGQVHPVSWRIIDFPDYDVDPTEPPPVAVPDYFVQQAAARIYAGGFDALTAASEARKTVEGFRGVTRRMVDLARRFSARRMQQLWLESRYAWRTLAYDVRDLHSALTDFDSKREIWTERAGLSFSESTSETLSTLNVTTGVHVLTRSKTLNWSLRGSVAGLIKPARFITNPVKTGWELVPYSFVVDWVYGVGVALDVMAFMAAAQSWTASKGWQCESTDIYTSTMESNARYNASGSVQYEYTGTRQSRSPTSINFKPQVTNRALSWDLSLDLQALSQVRSKFR